MKHLQATIVGYSESRAVAAICAPGDPEGPIQSLALVEGSDKAHLDLEFPNGAKVKVEIPHEFFEQQVFPQIKDRESFGDYGMW